MPLARQAWPLIAGAAGGRYLVFLSLFSSFPIPLRLPRFIHESMILRAVFGWGRVLVSSARSLP